jgi:phage-related protein
MAVKIRKVIAYQNHFEQFLISQPEKVQGKIYKIIEAIETLQRIPNTYLKHLTNADDLDEARIRLGSNIWREFCFFDDDKLVILLNGFVKKTERTPKNEINKALKLKQQYYADQKQ